MRKKFPFTLTYFRKNGKCYSVNTYYYSCLVDSAGDPKMTSILSHLRGRFATYTEYDDSNDGFYGFWTGPVMVQYDDWAPVLLFPEKL